MADRRTFLKLLAAAAATTAAGPTSAKATVDKPVDKSADKPPSSY